jgi:hypothetical protein
MNNNKTNTKKLELRKTAIANLTLSEAQMKNLFGGGEKNTKLISGDQLCQGAVSDSCNLEDTHCTGDIGNKTK